MPFQSKSQKCPEGIWPDAQRASAQPSPARPLPQLGGGVCLVSRSVGRSMLVDVWSGDLAGRRQPEWVHEDDGDEVVGGDDEAS